MTDVVDGLRLGFDFLCHCEEAAGRRGNPSLCWQSFSAMHCPPSPLNPSRAHDCRCAAEQKCLQRRITQGFRPVGRGLAPAARMHYLTPRRGGLWLLAKAVPMWKNYPSLRGPHLFAGPKRWGRKTAQRGGVKCLLPQTHAPSPLIPSRARNCRCAAERKCLQRRAGVVAPYGTEGLPTRGGQGSGRPTKFKSVRGADTSILHSSFFIQKPRQNGRGS